VFRYIHFYKSREEKDLTRAPLENRSVSRSDGGLGLYGFCALDFISHELHDGQLLRRPVQLEGKVNFVKTQS